jgi:hypothetical protein
VRPLLLACVVAVAAPACSLQQGGLDQDGTREGGGRDTGGRDGGRTDGGRDGASPPDTLEEDAAGFDAGDEDAGFDAGLDAGEYDAGFDAAEELDAGFDAFVPPSCDDLYGAAPGYTFCEETETECTFSAALSGSTCRALCSMYGGTCIRALDDGAPCVPFGGIDDCDTPRSTETCTCSRPP